ncbi:alpha-lactalbumin-like [Cynoglossus semilaevis]|uniref:alpha-lactalbumin-like n=1 Tax=Cynoglossus semilaevis TaxID=244447 RepID=UPI00049729DF|nr:alpha-lactalbumin-like [Cynoglossus semilaevis]
MKMERLVLVVLLLVLGCGLAHSRILTKCELINLIRNQAQQEQKIGNITIAKMVCHAEKLTGFDTSTLEEMTVGQKTWKLYGIFQFSNHMTCKEPGNHRRTTCDNLCSDFLDDDVEDDIACAIKIIKSILLTGKTPDDLLELIKEDKYFPQDCKDVTPDYLICEI